MDVKAELGDAFKFAEYDSLSNTFKVNGNLVGLEDVGVYKIEI